MMMKMVNGLIFIKDADQVQYSLIMKMGTFKWIKSHQMVQGPANAESLNKLAKMVRLPPYIEAERQRMNAVQNAVDYERTCERPSPLMSYPVKKQLYEHQVRAANMALLVFGILDPEEVQHG